MHGISELVSVVKWPIHVQTSEHFKNNKAPSAGISASERRPCLADRFMSSMKPCFKNFVLILKGKAYKEAYLFFIGSVFKSGFVKIVLMR